MPITSEVNPQTENIMTETSNVNSLNSNEPLGGNL